MLTTVRFSKRPLRKVRSTVSNVNDVNRMRNRILLLEQLKALKT